MRAYGPYWLGLLFYGFQIHVAVQAIRGRVGAAWLAPFVCFWAVWFGLAAYDSTTTETRIAEISADSSVSSDIRPYEIIAFDDRDLDRAIELILAEVPNRIFAGERELIHHKGSSCAIYSPTTRNTQKIALETGILPSDQCLLARTIDGETPDIVVQSERVVGITLGQASVFRMTFSRNAGFSQPTPVGQVVYGTLNRMAWFPFVVSDCQGLQGSALKLCRWRIQTSETIAVGFEITSFHGDTGQRIRDAGRFVANTLNLKRRRMEPFFQLTVAMYGF